MQSETSAWHFNTWFSQRQIYNPCLIILWIFWEALFFKIPFLSIHLLLWHQPSKNLAVSLWQKGHEFDKRDMDVTCSAEKWEEDLKGHYENVIICPVSKRICQLVFQAAIRPTGLHLLFFLLHFAEHDYLMMSLCTLYFTNQLHSVWSPPGLKGFSSQWTFSTVISCWNLLLQIARKTVPKSDR